MKTDFEDEDGYEPDSPEAVLRCAVAVACCDGEFASDEQDKVRPVYADICQEMTFAYNRPDVSDEHEEIAQMTSELILSLSGNQEKLEYIERYGALITDRDLREMTLVMAVRIAGADFELAVEEYRALKSLAGLWHISLSDVLSPYLDAHSTQTYYSQKLDE